MNMNHHQVHQTTGGKEKILKVLEKNRAHFIIKDQESERQQTFPQQLWEWSKPFYILRKNDPHLEVWFQLEYQSGMRTDERLFGTCKDSLCLFLGGCWRRTPPEQGFKPRKQRTWEPGKGERER